MAGAAPGACVYRHRSPSAAPAGRHRLPAGPALPRSVLATPRASPPRGRRTGVTTRRARPPRGVRRPGRTLVRPRVRGAARASHPADHRATRTTSPAGSRWGARSAPVRAGGPVAPGHPARTTHCFPDLHPLQARREHRLARRARPRARRTRWHGAPPSRARPTPRAHARARCAPVRRVSGNPGARRARAATAVSRPRRCGRWPRLASGRASRRPTRRRVPPTRAPHSIAGDRARRACPARADPTRFARRPGPAWRTGPRSRRLVASRTTRPHPSGHESARAGRDPRAPAPRVRPPRPSPGRGPRAARVAPRRAGLPRAATPHGRHPVRYRRLEACRARHRPGSSRAASDVVHPKVG